jgi:hypothetical protein
MNTRPFVVPALPLAASDSLSFAAVAVHSPSALLRGGPVQRAENLVARGVPVAAAAAIAAKQGKGHVGEVHQAAGYSTFTGAMGRPHHARPNPRANDPRVDVELRRGRRRLTGAQVKVGSPRYVLRAIESGKYDMLVANHEALDALGLDSDLDVLDRLTFGGSDGPQLSAADCEARATETIARVLQDELPFGAIDSMVLHARAGGRAAFETFVSAILTDLVHAVWSGQPFDLAEAARSALHSAGRGFARAAVQSHLLVRQFLARARRQFSDRLLHRIAGSAIMLGAIAEVVVETAIDLVRVLRHEMTFDDLLRSLGVHVCTAAGGALGMAIAAALTGGAAWWIQGLAMLAGGAAGAHCGRQVGTAIFSPPTLPATAVTQEI